MYTDPIYPIYISGRCDNSPKPMGVLYGLGPEGAQEKFNEAENESIGQYFARNTGCECERSI